MDVGEGVALVVPVIAVAVLVGELVAVGALLPPPQAATTTSSIIIQRAFQAMRPDKYLFFIMYITPSC